MSLIPSAPLLVVVHAERADNIRIISGSPGEQTRTTNL